MAIETFSTRFTCLIDTILLYDLSIINGKSVNPIGFFPSRH